MASETGQARADLKRELIANSREYDFYQVVRLLQRLRGEEEGGGVRFRPLLGLERSESGIAGMRETEAGYEIEPTFMALYGASSPLPVWYTSELLEDEWHEQSAARDLLDMLHQQIYPLLYAAWRKYRFALNAIEAEGGGERYWGMLYAFMGLYDPQMRARVPDAAGFLGQTGLFCRQARSAAALEAMLRASLGRRDVEIVECVPRQAAIPADQRLNIGKAGCTLGSDAVVGERVLDCCGRFQIRIGPIDAETFSLATQEGGLIERIRRICTEFLVQPLECEVVLVLDEGVVQPAALGGNDLNQMMGLNGFASLGTDAWVVGGTNAAGLEVGFML
ncbi:MAG TPA: type VI secretion system baseplate subunit TssG [Gammaproteobacteria bacterium]|jgi:type VI secretion system protein ImpH|nr:type VI secretion system baseplate subunit TssG [Gammaproteobacteria bacterium]